MSSVDEDEALIVEEYDRLMNYVHDLQRIDFFENNEFPADLTEAQRKRMQKIQLKKQNTTLTDGYMSSSDDEAAESQRSSEFIFIITYHFINGLLK